MDREGAPHYPKLRKPAKPKRDEAHFPHLSARELFSYLNCWTAEPECKRRYLTLFKSYLERKVDRIALDEVRRKMERPDFVRFFKHLREERGAAERSPSDGDEPAQPTAKGGPSIKRTLRKQDRIHIEGPDVPEVSQEDFMIVQHFFSSNKAVCAAYYTSFA